MHEVNFAREESSRRTINHWVEKATHEKITDLIPKNLLTPDTCMVITNAIYFKADWASRSRGFFSRLMEISWRPRCKSPTHFDKQVTNEQFTERLRLEGIRFRAEGQRIWTSLTIFTVAIAFMKAVLLLSKQPRKGDSEVPSGLLSLTPADQGVTGKFCDRS